MYGLKGSFEWGKQAKVAMILQDYTNDALAKKVGLNPRYVSQLINGSVYSERAVKKISDALGIRSY